MVTEVVANVVLSRHLVFRDMFPLLVSLEVTDVVIGHGCAVITRYLDE